MSRYSDSPKPRTSMKVLVLESCCSPQILIEFSSKIRILCPSDYFPTSNKAQADLIERFITGLESAVQSTRIATSLAEQWKTDSVDGARHSDIAEYLELVRSYSAHQPRRTSVDFSRPYGVHTIIISIMVPQNLEISTRRMTENSPSIKKLHVGSGTDIDSQRYQMRGLLTCRFQGCRKFNSPTYSGVFG